MKRIPFPDCSQPSATDVLTDVKADAKSARPRHEELAIHLLGPGATGLEVPALTDLALALCSLAEGKRRKAILPLSASTGEFALVRRGSEVLLSYYDSGPVPQIFVRDRCLDLLGLIALCGKAASEQCVDATDRTPLLIAERALRTTLVPDRQLPPVTVVRRGSAQAREAGPLSFGFSARLCQGEAHSSDAGTRADVHALLFDGELWAHAHERRLLLVKGPIFPAVSRMIYAARSLVEAWESQRPLALKLRAGDFGIGVRMSRAGEVALTLLGPSTEPVTLPALDVPSALLPILRLGSELVRAVVSTDRSQAKNLRLTSLRDEVRALRRVVKNRAAQKSFVNREPELLRASSLPSAREREPGAARVPDQAGRLRLSLRWRAEVEGLDAASTFLCGDRLVVATPRSQLALSREDGALLWMRQRAALATLMAGTALVCVGADGTVELCDLADGEAYARARVTPRSGASMLGLCVGGRGAPPVAVITEGRDRLVAIDTRTGEPRWRFRSAGRGDFKLTRAGRIMLVVSGDNTLDAVDVTSGEVAWRWSDQGRIAFAPVVMRDRVFAVAGHPGSGIGALLCLDLFSGQLIFRRELSGSPLMSPLAGDSVVVISSLEGGVPKLLGFDLNAGELRWQREDPGLGEGGSGLVVDQRLVVNAALGAVSAVDLASGELAWQHHLADPTRDDVPRRLEPVLRGGALFVPSASVHVVRPGDGTLMGAPLGDTIIPDFMRVDERGWLYLAEESGHLEAYAPAPHLRLVK
jgi:outer membrane protein assembly factor BamB